MIIGYLRLSQETDGLGIERQRQDVTRLAESHGNVITHWLIDEDASASQYAKKARPKFEQLVKHLETSQVAAIYVAHLDRFVRRPADLERVFPHLDAVPIYSAAGGPVALDTPEGRAMARVGTAFAAMETDAISRRICRKHLEKAEAGQYSGSHVPYAFDAVDGRLVPNPERVALLRECGEGILAGSLSITAAGEKMGLSRTGVRSALTCPAVLGIRSHQGKEYPAEWPAVLDADLVEKLKAKFASRSRVSKPKALLTGYLTCGKCGAKLSSKQRYGNGTSRSVYVCNEKGCYGINRAAWKLEEEAAATVVEQLGSDGAVAWALGDLGQRRQILSTIDYEVTLT